MSIRHWVFGFAWTVMSAINVAAAHDITYGLLTFSGMMFVLTLAEAALDHRQKDYDANEH